MAALLLPLVPFLHIIVPSAVVGIGVLTTGIFGALKYKHDQGQKRGEEPVAVPALFHFHNVSNFAGQDMRVLKGMVAESLPEEGNKAVFRNEEFGFEVNGTVGKGSAQDGLWHGHFSFPFGVNATVGGNYIVVDVSADNDTMALFDELYGALSSLENSGLAKMFESLFQEEKSGNQSDQ